jgi:hypothetical protein
VEKLLLAFALFYCHSTLIAQVQIKGRIMDEANKPLPAASVYLSGTSFGTLANTEGNFLLSKIPRGRYNLVVSFAGYQTFSINIDTREIDILELKNITLLSIANELENVVVSGFEKGTWQQWGTFFLENFFGTVPEATRCKLKNHKAISFRHFKKQGILTARAHQPLVIENRALGYNIRYQLGTFEYNFNTRYLLITGFPLFAEMKPNNVNQQEKWERAREDVYRGSQLHFLRSLYHRTIEEDGFEIRMLIKQPNTEKERVRLLMKNMLMDEKNTGAGFNNQPVMVMKGDSTNYYQSILKQPDAIDYLYNTLLSADSITYPVNEIRMGLLFENYLHVTHTQSLEQIEFVKSWGQDNNRPPAPPVSLLFLHNLIAVEIEPSGAYYAPEDLLLMGYWAWSQKMATMVPYDYKQEVKPISLKPNE